MCGDSLIANEIGGNIPGDIDEGASMRPIRMNYNNVPRRLYDRISWNKPIWRRMDNAAWTKSNFNVLNVSFFDGDSASEKYYYCNTSGGYAEITIPQGYEHFAFICRTAYGKGKINVTLNGGAVGTYSNPYYTSQVSTNTVVNETIVPQTIDRGLSQINTGFATGDGNPIAIYTYYNLPSGQDNVLRFTANDATEIDVWGGFYWTGNTCAVINLGHGGHTTSDLKSHYIDELFPCDYDAIIFEVPEMNNLRLTLDKTKNDLEYYFSKLAGKDVLFTSCNPLGLSIVHDVNYYTEYNDPTQEQVNSLVRNIMFSNAKPFINLFDYYKQNIENRGGTLAGGEGGLWYTWDGQHGNPAGVKMWSDILWSELKNKPITFD